MILQTWAIWVWKTRQGLAICSFRSMNSRTPSQRISRLIQLSSFSPKSTSTLSNKSIRISTARKSINCCKPNGTSPTNLKKTNSSRSQLNRLKRCSERRKWMLNRSISWKSRFTTFNIPSRAFLNQSIKTRKLMVALLSLDALSSNHQARLNLCLLIASSARKWCQSSSSRNPSSTARADKQWYSTSGQTFTIDTNSPTSSWAELIGRSLCTWFDSTPSERTYERTFQRSLASTRIRSKRCFKQARRSLWLKRPQRTTTIRKCTHTWLWKQSMRRLRRKNSLRRKKTVRVTRSLPPNTCSITPRNSTKNQLL